MRRSYSAGASLMAGELKAHPQAAVRVSYDLAVPFVAQLVYARCS